MTNDRIEVINDAMSFVKLYPDLYNNPVMIGKGMVALKRQLNTKYSKLYGTRGNNK